MGVGIDVDLLFVRHSMGVGIMYVTRHGGGKLMGFVSWDLNNFMSAACQKVCELSYRSAIVSKLVIHCPMHRTLIA